jgi:glycosyltransferase involved in cell wall biosynthesis
MSSLRFAFVCPNFHPRVCGVGDHTARLGDELRRRGHEVQVFSRSPVARHPEAPELQVQGVGGRFPTLIALGMARALRDFRPTDLVLQYTSQMWDAWRFGTPAQVGLAAAARRAGARVTLIAHELFVPWGRRPDLASAALLQRVQLMALVKQCDRFFVTTDTRVQVVSGLTGWFGLPQPRVVRVGPNALPLARRDDRAAEDRMRPRIGFFSTLAYGKRFDVVLDAFGEISRAFPLAELVLLGDFGPTQNPKVRALMSSISAHPARDRIRITGKLSLPEISATISGLDLYLFPMGTGANTRSGTLPVALGSGIPVVAIHGVETDDALFRDEENVLFARALDAPAFADSSLRILRDPVLAARLGNGARALYDRHLTWSGIADQFLAGL